MNALADRFQDGANRFLECIASEERNATYERLMADMNIATLEAWNSGLLNSIMPLVKHFERWRNSPFQERFEVIIGGNVFSDFVGYTELDSSQNDKIDWDCDESGETVLHIDPIKSFYLKPGMLSEWGLVAMRPVYVGEVFFGNADYVSPWVGAKVLKDDDQPNCNWIEGADATEILKYHSDSCTFLFHLLESELKLYSEPMQKYDVAKKLGMSGKMLQRSLRSGAIRHLADSPTAKMIRVHVDHLKNISKV